MKKASVGTAGNLPTAGHEPHVMTITHSTAAGKLNRPGPQPPNQIAAAFEEQLARAERPRRVPDDQAAVWADLRRLYRVLRHRFERAAGGRGYA